MTHKIGGHVLSLCSLEENGLEICAPGDRGQVVHVSEEGMPTVRFYRTGRASLMDADDEVVATASRARAVA